MLASSDWDFFEPRQCLRDPIPELWQAAATLQDAAEAHLNGKHGEAHALLCAANNPIVRAWTESLWGSQKANPDQWRYRRLRPVRKPSPHLPKAERVPARKPNAAEQAAIIKAYGRDCVFCGIPLIRAEVRSALNRLYPEAAPWGPLNVACHAAFQCLWLQCDHLLPHSRGGNNSISNVVVTCAGCNYDQIDNTLDELGLMDPRDRALPESHWDGLEHMPA